MKLFLFLFVLTVLATSGWAQERKTLAQGEPLGCLTAHIDADKDPKPTQTADEDAYAHSKRMTEWQKREDLRNPKKEIEFLPVNSGYSAPKAVETPASSTIIIEKQRINPIQYILDKGWATKERILAVAPHFPFLVGEPNNENIADYQQIHLAAWMSNYPREAEAFFNKLVSPEKLDEVPEFED